MTTRRLAAILAADVVGYSRMIGADEVGTLSKLTALRREVIDPLVAENGGRVFKTTGDGLLAEFPSTVQALRCAIGVQERLRGGELQLRIGVHQGDVVVEGDDLLGDGVNVAARLEGLAEPGGICISGRVREDAAGKRQLGVEDLGEPELKNITQRHRVFRVRPEQPERPTLPLPDKPSIAVLPFANMSGDPEQEYFADGMVEEIITGLSRVRSFFVIARNSSFAYKGKSPDVRQVGRELGVRYVLEGSVRKAGNRVRITGQLVDATTGAHLWADRFDGTLEDIFDLQDRVTASVVGAIEPNIRSAETERAQRKPTESLQAYDLLLRALPHLYSTNRERLGAAIHLLRQATEIDPTYALALVYLGFCLWGQVAQGWVPRTEERMGEITRLGNVALEHGGDDPEVLSFAATLVGQAARDLAGGIALAEKAIALNGNSVQALNRAGVLHALAGNVETAVGYLEHAARLSPVDRIWVGHLGFTYAYFVAGRYDAVLEVTEQALRQWPNYLSFLIYRAATLALLGRVEEGREVVQRILSTNPAAMVVPRWLVLKPPEAVAALREGLRRCGLPE
jgi:adenylate cyclase